MLFRTILLLYFVILYIFIIIIILECACKFLRLPKDTWLQIKIFVHLVFKREGEKEKKCGRWFMRLTVWRRRVRGEEGMCFFIVFGDFYIVLKFYVFSFLYISYWWIYLNGKIQSTFMSRVVPDSNPKILIKINPISEY